MCNTSVFDLALNTQEYCRHSDTLLLAFTSIIQLFIATPFSEAFNSFFECEWYIEEWQTFKTEYVKKKSSSNLRQKVNILSILHDQ